MLQLISPPVMALRQLDKGKGSIVREGDCPGSFVFQISGVKKLYQRHYNDSKKQIQGFDHKPKKKIVEENETEKQE
jgi:hypothetical protein